MEIASFLMARLLTKTLGVGLKLLLRGGDNMFMKDVCLETQATKKAIEYYIEQGLITPTVLKNGYRDFSCEDCEKLKKISMFRKLGLSVEEIKMAINSNEELSKIAVKRELNLRAENDKKNLIDKISTGANTEEVLKELKDIEKNKTITQKLLEAFPGYYGRFIALHFSMFLNEPISTIEQQEAYDQIVKFLDEAPSLDMPDGLKDFLIENTKHISVDGIEK
ncbi:MerR family transcriptional regulator, partial [Intestinibacter sp.]|uniref:MerR family transcriptional regulator n=1 Tax=Intestinibacter sp. TaxID=1965304 RepID=UPI003F14A3E8